MAKNKMNGEIKFIELFAGVGGFRLGLESASSRKRKYRCVWSNQWEPGTRTQHASDVYVSKWGGAGHSNEDISKVNVADIPGHDLLVGGFPCQDYSVARTLSHAEGIVGKKGVLWWDIYRIIEEKKKKRSQPQFLILENVDRLLKSPAKQRGRDFAIMLASLSDLGYAVEWRVINAADYGKPQRRRRTFILGYAKGTEAYEQIRTLKKRIDWVLNSGTIARAFPVKATDDSLFDTPFEIKGDLVEITNGFVMSGHKGTPFENAGLMFDRKVYTIHTKPDYKGKRITLGDVLQDEKAVPPEFFINEDDMPRWQYLKGPKNEPRRTRTGFEYIYTEGGMVFPDPLSKPSRTIVTGEGGSTPSRFKHVITTPSGKLRRLTPVELERLNQFPDGHTEGPSDIRRAFFMGNALVVGVIEGLGKTLLDMV